MLGLFRKKCGCGEEYDEAAWNKLPFRGRSNVKRIPIEWRDCPRCKTTMIAFRRNNNEHPQSITAFRNRTLIDKFPKLRKLESKLLKLGGAFVVLRPDSINDLDKLMDRGEVFKGSLPILKPGHANECHVNSARIWFRNPHKVRIVTGYALSQIDSLWHQHSWLLDRKDDVVETTVERDLYYGYTLTQGEAMIFTRAQGEWKAPWPPQDKDLNRILNKER